MKIIVYHSYYGCDTGCCGHRIEVSEGGESSGDGHFEFDHPADGQDHLEFAKQFVRDRFGEEHVADLDWEHCVIEDE